VTPAAKQKSVKTTASVRQPDDDEQGEPGRRLRREQREGRHEKIDGAWLISTFDPV
jgi:hypothetical protein